MACTQKALSNEFHLWFFPGNHAWAGPVEIADGISWLNGRYLKKAPNTDKLLKQEKHRYVKALLATIAEVTESDPERAYRLAMALQDVGVPSYYRADLSSCTETLKAMPRLQAYPEAEAAMHALVEKHFATSVMDFRNNNCPRQLTSAADTLADKYKDLKLAATIRKMGGPTQIP